jgi:hypothetical protein
MIEREGNPDSGARLMIAKLVASTAESLRRSARRK